MRPRPAASTTRKTAATSDTKHLEAESFASHRGISTEACTDTSGGYNIAQLNNGNWTLVRASRTDPHADTGIRARRQWRINPRQH